MSFLCQQEISTSKVNVIVICHVKSTLNIKAQHIIYCEVALIVVSYFYLRNIVLSRYLCKLLKFRTRNLQP